MEGQKIHHRIYEGTSKKVEFTAKTLECAKAIIARYPEGKQKSALIPLLHIAQEEFGGYLSTEALDYVASLLGIRPVEAYEAATFYTQYYLEEAGKFVVEVCRTGPCAVCGAEDILGKLESKLGIKAGETTADKLFTLKTVECLGACGYGPVMQVNTVFYEKLTEDKIDDIIESLRNKAGEEQPKGSKWAEKFSLNI